ncbi:MAG: DNA recombination protein RmuC [Rhizomicrobium sp.]
MTESIAVFGMLALVLAVAAFLAGRLFAARSAAAGIDTAPLLGRLEAINACVERLDRVVREDGEMARSGADERGRLLREEVAKSLADSRTEMSGGLAGVRGEIVTALEKAGQELRESSADLSRVQKERLNDVALKVERLSETNTKALEALRETLQRNLDTLRTDNAEKLEAMRQTVDEKLQGTLEKRLSESFRLVSERLEEVHKGLGEMQTLATGVGDLKRVLTNVKVRGTWGETQLANLLAQVFSPEQYYTNCKTKPGSSERVEFAIRFPGRGPDDAEVLLPIDAKFPREDYERLVEASEQGDTEGVEAAARALELRIKSCARDIRDKYISPPETTDFAILFLPTEGLYAEVLRRGGLADTLQLDYRVAVAGPTTLNALLTSLQVGFKTLAIQRRSSEVWQVLSQVKTEFGKYGDVLEKVKKKLQEASNTVDAAAVRHRAVSRSLNRAGDGSDLPAPDVAAIAEPMQAEPELEEV